MAEGDKVVPSGGNPQLDPTARGALNSTLGVTQGSLNGSKLRSGNLQSANFVRNQSGLLVNVNDLEMDVARQSVMRRNWKGKGSRIVSEDVLKDRGMKARDLRPIKAEKSGGSPDGEGMTDSSSYLNQQQQGKKPVQRDKGAAFSPSYGTLTFNSPIMKGAATMAMACLPFNGLVPRIVGPFLVSINNHDGGFVQTNIPEATSKGRNVNAVDTETPADGS